MKLLTKAVAKALPPLYATDGKGDAAMVVVKFFDPTGSYTWYGIEANAVMKDGTEKPVSEMDLADFPHLADVLFFGLVKGDFTELGNFSLAELASVKGRFGLGIERDLHFTPLPLGEVKAKLANGGHV